jgi:carbamoyl-phosphate synthase small subunit
VVFNTSLTGYQEIITDPSYRGQMVCMTLAHVGNTGVNAEDVESDQPQVTAFVVREVSSVVSNWRANETLHDYLARHGIPGISEVDTRALTRRLREKGVLHGALCTDGSAQRGGIAGAGARLGRAGRARPGARSHLRRAVSLDRRHARRVDAGARRARRRAPRRRVRRSLTQPLVVAYDFGIKQNILRRLTSHGLRVTVVRHETRRKRCWRCARTASS